MKEIPLIRTSERRTFKECPWAWWQIWREGLKPRGAEADHFWFGTGVHLALAEWYSGPGLVRGPHPVETWLEYVGEEERDMRLKGHDEDAKFVDAKALGESMLTRYVEVYGEDESWEVIQPEMPFQIQIPYRKKDGTMAIYAGTIDLVYRDLETGGIKLGEHKTAANISVTHLQIDDQAGAYWAIASKILQEKGVLRRGDIIEGITYNFLRKVFPDDRPVNKLGQKLNKDGSVSKRQPKPEFERHHVERSQRERRTQLLRIQNEATWMDLARRHPDSIMKSPRYDCARRCQLYTLCELNERGGNAWLEYREAMFVRKDPYADHRKSAEE